MEATVVISVFVAFIFGTAMLMLVMGYMSTEERRAQQEKERHVEVLPVVQAAADVPRFFATLDASRLPTARPAFDDALLAHLEDRLRSEQALVSQFVDEPSIANLYRQVDLPAAVH